MACYACAWYAQLCGGWNPVRLLLLVQLAFVLLGSSLTIAESDSVYYDYDVPSSNQYLTEQQVTHEFHTNELNGAILSRRRRNVDEKPNLQLENAAQSTDTNDNGLTDNVTKIRFGTHLYYNSTIFSDEKIAETYRVDMDNNSNLRVSDPFDRRDEIKTTVHLKFEFPFYGLKIHTIQIATDGYLFTGEENIGARSKYVQYIAPLMANFETSLSTNSRVTYADNGTALTVEWKDMILQDKPEAGSFTFQVTLHENGDIVFVYSNIPLATKVLNNTSGPVRIGVSDAYKMERNFMNAPRITIFEYHRINFNFEDISNGSAIYLKPLPTCISMNNCNDCTTKVPHFECKWCPALQKCNAGKSRIWQNWIENGCEKTKINGDNSCQTTQHNVTLPSNVSPLISDGVRNNVTKFAVDSHLYYNSTIANNEKLADEYWVDMDDKANRQVIDVVSQEKVSIVELKFDFPFYGYKIRNITILRRGFLHTGDYPQGAISATQYIAPLMADFTTALSNNSRISYADNGTAFTVEWEEVLLQNHPEVGSFTFQVTLHKNGDIVFVYRKIPLAIEVLQENLSLVKIGVSDAYIADRVVFFVRRKTIYEYDRISFHFEEIGNGTSIYLKPLPTCISMENCNDCLTKVPHMACKWCPAIQKCSNGLSKFRQNWLENSCDYTNIKEQRKCPAMNYNPSKFDSPKRNSKYESNANRIRRAIASAESDDSHTNDSNDSTLSRKRRYVSREPVPSVAYDATSEPPENKTDAASVNVTYSTDKVTTVASAMNPVDKLHLPDVNSTAKIDAPKSSKNTTIVVSNPMNPVTGQPVHVWANQTRWENATRKPDMKITEKPDPPKPNAPTLNTEEKTNANGTPGVKASNATSTDKIVVSTTNATDSDLGDISISKFSDVTNNTLAQNNITKTEEDTHQYYNSTFFSDENIAKSYWVDMDNHPDRQVNDLLSQSHRRAATVKLKFDFPFYGHKVRNITIATGGFLYTGEYVHSWLAATQYIAPLMANFDTRLSNASWVKYADNGTAFTVEWEEVVLQDRPEAGGFTFQATLHDNGNIVFVYSKIPLTVEAIEDTAHPVKVGLSDAYIMDRTIFFVRRKTIYEYHRVNFNHQEIQNWTVIYLKALPTCLELDNCNDCLTKVPEFECKWCPELKQCSTGTFRFRQDWLEKGCEQKNIKEPNSCPATQTSYTENLDSRRDHPGHARSDAGLSASVDQNTIRAKGAASPSILEHSASNMNMGVSGIIGILIVVTLIAGLVAWAGYAYRNPHSASGQMLIRYRPSQWSWRRGEARYTAATIHM